MLPSFGVPSRRRSATIGALTLAGLAIAATASAHVTVSPTSLPQGSTAELTFKVPNEESNAHTVSLQLQIPTDHPIAQLLAKPVPGWTISVHTVTLATPLKTDDGTFTTAVNEVDWTGGSIQPGQYEDFRISVDPLPSDTTQLVFKAVQTYSNGDVVRWIDLGTGSDRPAPVLTLTSDSPASATPTATPVATTSSSSNDSLGIAGLVLGAIGAASGVAALLFVRKTRRSESS